MNCGYYPEIMTVGDVEDIAKSFTISRFFLRIRKLAKLEEVASKQERVSSLLNRDLGTFDWTPTRINDDDFTVRLAKLLNTTIGFFPPMSFPSFDLTKTPVRG